MPGYALTRAGLRAHVEDRRSGEGRQAGPCRRSSTCPAGDSLVVWRLDRLGRSLSDLIALVRCMEEAGVQLRSPTEGIEPPTTNGKLTFHLFAALADRAGAGARAHAGWP